MNAKYSIKLLVWSVILTLVLTACAPGGTQLIGSYPASGEPKPLAVLPRSAPQPGVMFVYDAWITLQVSSVVTAGERAENLAYRHNGYLESSSTWYQDDRQYMTLVLAVPSSDFEALRKDLLNLGSLQNEQVSGDWKGPYDSWPSYSHITLTLQPRAFAWPEWPDLGWNPGDTLRQAWGVFLSIFGFLVDILIWVVVVLGPFALMGLGVRALWRRFKR